MPAWRGEGPNPNYVREFDARVLKATPGEEPWLLLDRTAFYAEGGGQPSDRGRITWDGGEATIRHVSKKGAVKHAIDGELPPAGAALHGLVDWDLRHAHMRMHTSQHLLSGLLWKLKRAHTVGNQIHADRSRVDFDATIAAADLRDVENAVNEVLAKQAVVRVYEQDRDTIAQRTGDRGLLNLVPQSARVLRIVEILLPEEASVVDVCPCAGTHVATTAEIGRMEIVHREGKGDGKTRLEYVLK